MYSQGETFYYEINDEEYELHVVENISLKDKEYIIAEDFDGQLHVFLYDEDEDEIILLDEFDSMEIIEYWEEEYLGDSDDISDYDEDDYYDREDEEFQDRYDNEDYFEDEEEYY